MFTTKIKKKNIKFEVKFKMELQKIKKDAVNRVLNPY